MQGNVDDAIRYNSNIKNELDENLGYLQLEKGAQENPESNTASFHEAT